MFYVSSRGNLRPALAHGRRGVPQKNGSRHRRPRHQTPAWDTTSEAHLLLDGISGYARRGHALAPDATCRHPCGASDGSRWERRPVSGGAGDTAGSTRQASEKNRHFLLTTVPDEIHRDLQILVGLTGGTPPPTHAAVSRSQGARKFRWGRDKRRASDREACRGLPRGTASVPVRFVELGDAVESRPLVRFRDGVDADDATVLDGEAHGSVELTADIHPERRCARQPAPSPTSGPRRSEGQPCDRNRRGDGGQRPRGHLRRQ